MRERFRCTLPWSLAFVLSLTGLVQAAPERAVRADVLSDDGRTTVLELRLLRWEAPAVTIGGREFHEITIPGEAISLEAGAPGLPHASRAVIVPDDGASTVRVLDADFHDLPLLVAPSKGNLLRSVDPASVPYRFGAGYAGCGFRPEAIVSLSDPFILRDWRGVAVRWSPFQYDPSAGTLRVHERVTIEITTSASGAPNAMHRALRANRPVRTFEQLYRGFFVNHAERARSLLYPPLDEDGELLVIAYDAWLANLAPLVSHKTALGISTTVVGVSTIGNNAASIRSYIQSYYDTHNLAFVLLVGDSGQVATPTVSGDNASDPSYAKLAGADDYPDIQVGRFSAQTAAQVDTQVRRTIDYEAGNVQSSDWYWRGTGIASAEGAGAGDEGQSDIQHEDEIRGWLLGADYSQVDRIYDPGATDAMVASALNAGRGIVNYTGHGWAQGWGTTGFDTNDVDGLANAGQLPFIVSVACNNGEFNHYDPCFGEAWLRASRDGDPTGAIGIYASSVSQSWAPPMEAQDEINIRVADPEQPYWSFGGLCFAGSSSMIAAYGADGVYMFDTWHVFGDPSARVLGAAAPQSGLVVSPASGFLASGQVGGPFSPQSKTYTVRNADPAPLDYEIRVSVPWLEVGGGRGTLAPGQSAPVTVALASDARDQDAGIWTDPVGFVNLTSHVGDATRAAALDVGAPIATNRWPLDTSPGWTMQGQWQFGTPAGLGGGGGSYPDPTSGHTGASVYGVNLAGNVSGKVGVPYHLTMGPVNLTGVHGTTLRFWRWLNAGLTVASTIDVSTDGATWTNVWSASGIYEGSWTQQSYDISAVADGHAQVYVRWGYQVSGLIPGIGSGWNVDDVEIWGEVETGRIALSVGRDRLDWVPIAGVPQYDVVRGSLDVLRATGGDFATATEACLANDAAATTLTSADAPAEGAGLWYLVRGASWSGPLTYQDLEPSQAGVRDEAIAAAAAACP